MTLQQCLQEAITRSAARVVQRSSTQGDQFQAEKVNFLITPAFKATFLPARLGEI
jgi:hypothetical protein